MRPRHGIRTPRRRSTVDGRRSAVGGRRSSCVPRSRTLPTQTCSGAVRVLETLSPIPSGLLFHVKRDADTTGRPRSHPDDRRRSDWDGAISVERRAPAPARRIAVRLCTQSRRSERRLNARPLTAGLTRTNRIPASVPGRGGFELDLGRVLGRVSRETSSQVVGHRMGHTRG